MKIKLIFYTLLLFVFSCDDKEQVDEQIDIEYETLISVFGSDTVDSYGIGIISDSEYNESGIINVPDSFMNAYDKPDGNIIGKIYKEGTGSYGVLFEDTEGNRVSKINRKDFIEITYEGSNLKYYNSKDGYYQCLIHSINSGIWISAEDILKLGFEPLDWKKFLKETNRRYHSLDSQGLLMFDSAMNVIDTLIRGINEVKLLENENGELINVDIYNVTDCEGGDGQKTGNAWMKIIDKNGHPLIFYYSRGC